MRVLESDLRSRFRAEGTDVSVSILFFSLWTRPMMNLATRTIRTRAVVGVFVFVTGCGGSSPDPFARVPVSGAVQLDGAPVEFGTIAFTGESIAEKQEVASLVAAIQGGKFSTLSQARGTTAGDNAIVVTIYKTDPAAATAEGPPTEVVGYWKGDVSVQSGQSVDLNIKSTDLKKR